MGGSERSPDAAVSEPWVIVGQGLAGTSLAWEFWNRSVPFQLVDREHGGSSRVAAGLINPVTGKNFEPTPRIGEFLPEALEFYRNLEALLKSTFWHPMPILRLADSDREWAKMISKIVRPDVACWISNDGAPVRSDGWHGALELIGGGRLDTRAFLDASQAFFQEHGIYQHDDVSQEQCGERHVWCDGAAGLIRGRYGAHRCAKGEILTLQAPDWDETQIRIGAGGWLVPLGNGRFKAGSTYEWEQLDEKPTEAGSKKIMSIVSRLGGSGGFEIINHEAGIRPILRRSEPKIGPLDNGGWMFNGLGSKGSIFAPGMARRLANWICEGIAPEESMKYNAMDFFEN